MNTDEWKIAKARGEELRQRRESIIAKAIKDITVSNQTPPVWAKKAALEIDNEFMRSKWAAIIAAHAPDCEALAVALETIARADESDFGYDKPHIKMIELARAAIAKAKGQP